MKLIPWLQYPWSEMMVGQSFFVPILQKQKARQDAIHSALDFRYTVRVTPGILDGKYGVLIERLR